MRVAGSAAEAFYFGIPMIPLSYTRDPQGALALLRTTVASLLRQTDPNFQIWIAAEETLPLGFRDPRIHWLHSPPQARGWKDMRWRQTRIAAQLRNAGGGWLMFVDADDLVSRRVVRHVRSHRERADGFLARVGWEYDCRAMRIRLAPRFWNMCGTSLAIRWRPEELPESPSSEPCDEYILTARNHSFWPAGCRDRGKVMRAFPFPPAVYRIFHGDNLSLQGSFQHGWKRAVWRNVVPALRPTQGFREEFGL